MFRKQPKKQAPSWRAMLKVRPMRNPELEWVEEDGKVVLLLKHGQDKQKSLKRRIMGIFLPTPPDRRVELDSIGTDVWLLIDGKETIGSIAEKLAKKYRLSTREAEMSLQQYCKELGRRGYVAFVKGQKTTDVPAGE